MPEKEFGLIQILVAFVVAVQAFFIRTFYKMPEKYVLKTDCRDNQLKNNNEKDNLHSRISDLGTKVDSGFNEIKNILIDQAERRNQSRGPK